MPGAELDHSRSARARNAARLVTMSLDGGQAISSFATKGAAGSTCSKLCEDEQHPFESQVIAQPIQPRSVADFA